MWFFPLICSSLSSSVPTRLSLTSRSSDNLVQHDSNPAAPSNVSNNTSSNVSAQRDESNEPQDLSVASAGASTEANVAASSFTSPKKAFMLRDAANRGGSAQR